MNRLITQILRIIVGGLFIFSGLIKLNDPMGMAFKLEDYFAPDVLNLTFLIPITLGLALVIVIAEVLLGVALLLGWKSKLTIRLLMALIVFFTFLTFYSAYFNKVTDCGCFGDAIPLTPWQSFTKDIILLVFILWIWKFERQIRPILSPKSGVIAMSVVLLLNVWMGYYVLRHLPFIDFRAYAVGKNIADGMKPAEELGLEPPKHLTYYTMVNKETGAEKKVDSDAYVKDKWWKDEAWEIDSDRTFTKQISKGYEPPIHDFVLELDGDDVTDAVLEEDEIVLIISYDLRKVNAKHFPRINSFIIGAEERNIPVLMLTASDGEWVEDLRHEHQLAFPFALADQTTLKTIVRANPGVVILQKGTVVAKWNPRDLPESEKFFNR
ncbi:MAG: DoxX family membrane protein [Cryomorphaceae bacterium]|nr:DoxX family membrane protein [Cryomorphaceae bacterium]